MLADWVVGMLLEDFEITENDESNDEACQNKI